MPPRIAVLYAPNPRSSVQRVSAGRDAVYASIFENVTGSIHAFKLDPATGAWSDTRLEPARRRLDQHHVVQRVRARGLFHL